MSRLSSSTRYWASSIRSPSSRRPSSARPRSTGPRSRATMLRAIWGRPLYPRGGLRPRTWPRANGGRPMVDSLDHDAPIRASSATKGSGQDDSVPVQNCINYTVTTGRLTCYLIGGPYTCTTDILVPVGAIASATIDIQGAGWNTPQLIFSGAGGDEWPLQRRHKFFLCLQHPEPLHQMHGRRAGRGNGFQPPGRADPQEHADRRGSRPQGISWPRTAMCRHGIISRCRRAARPALPRSSSTAARWSIGTRSASGPEAPVARRALGRPHATRLVLWRYRRAAAARSWSGARPKRSLVADSLLFGVDLENGTGH